MSDIPSLILDNLSLYVWAKDKNFKYIFCNEKYAEIAGIDSPRQIVGKADDALPWARLANCLKYGDHEVIVNGVVRVNSIEVSQVNGNSMDILVSENQLTKSDGSIIGVVGSFIDITGNTLIKKCGQFDKEKNIFNLGEQFSNEYLTKKEFEIFKYLLLGYTSEKTASLINISPKTVETHINHIKLKLQCSSKGEVVATSIRYGLTHILCKD